MNIPFWTLSGTVDLTDLRPENLTAGILASGLAKLNRFSGRTREPWPVAAHSVLVERLCPPELGPWALLHDGHEVFIGDMTPPAVDLIAATGRIPQLNGAIASAKGKIDRSIGSAWQIAVRSMSPDLRRADRIALLAEAQLFLNARPMLMEPGDEDDIDRAMSILMEISALTDWRAACDLWLCRVEYYAHLGWMTPPKVTQPACGLQA